MSSIQKDAGTETEKAESSKSGSLLLAKQTLTTTRTGQDIVIKGLESKPELNGQNAHIIACSNNGARWVVMPLPPPLADPSCIRSGLSTLVALKAESLTTIDGHGGCMHPLLTLCDACGVDAATTHCSDSPLMHEIVCDRCLGQRLLKQQHSEGSRFVAKPSQTIGGYIAAWHQSYDKRDPTVEQWQNAGEFITASVLNALSWLDVRSDAIAAIRKYDSGGEESLYTQGKYQRLWVGQQGKSWGVVITPPPLN